MQNIYLPNIVKVKLNSFSLYSASNTKDGVVLNLEKPASCLLGANGIGKSTLLNCICFGLTGFINNQNAQEKKMKSIDEYFKHNDYHRDYFDGRINEIDKENASISIEFVLNDNKVYLERRFFPSQIIKCEVDGKNCVDYEQAIMKSSKLSKFNQFAFIVLKLLTFDESRDCIFWNEATLTPLLYLCMGEDSVTADKADLLLRDIRKYDSKIRNTQWDIKKLSDRMQTLYEEKSSLISIEIDHNNSDENDFQQNDYDNIIALIEEKEKKRNAFLLEKKSLEAKLSELTLASARRNDEYQKKYYSLFNKVSIKEHPLILKLINESCPICGKKHEILPDKTIELIKNSQCPLCYENIDSTNDPKAFDELFNMDQIMKKLSDDLNESSKRMIFLHEEIANLNVEINTLNNKKFEYEINLEKTSMMKNASSWDLRIKALQEEIYKFQEKKEEEQKKKDDLVNEYDKMRITMQKTYKDIEESFLPIFRKYAYAFTGLNLDMSLGTVTNEGRKLFKFSLKIEDSYRKSEFELSESQRFFIDIAFRMALIIHVCSIKKQCSMLIDTPEGSLDIAYETNAGNMFSAFIEEGNKLIITANLNSSGLIKTFAEKTGKDNFEIIQMLKWATLSGVQIKHYELFNSAIQEIEGRLKK